MAMVVAWRPPPAAPPLRAVPSRRASPHPTPAPETAAHLLSSVFSRSRPTPPRIRRKIPAANQRPCLSSMKPNSPTPPTPQATGSQTPLSLTSSDFAPKQAQARGPTPGNRAYQTCSHTPNRPQPHLPTPGSATTRGCTGSKLGFHSCLPQIRRVITAQKPNTMLIKSATRPKQKPAPNSGQRGSEFQGKTAAQAAKGRKASRPPHPKPPPSIRPASAQPPDHNSRA